MAAIRDIVGHKLIIDVSVNVCYYINRYVNRHRRMIMWEIEKDSAGVYLREGFNVTYLGTPEQALSIADEIRNQVVGQPVGTGMYDWMTKVDAYEMANRINPDKFPLDKTQPYGNQPIAQRLRYAISQGLIASRGELIKREDFIRWMHETRYPRGTTADE